MAHLSALFSQCKVAILCLILSLNFDAAQAQCRQNAQAAGLSQMCNLSDSTLMHNPDTLEMPFIAFADKVQRLSPAMAADTMRQTVERLFATKNRRKKELLRQRLMTYAQNIFADSTSERYNTLLYSMFSKIVVLTYYASMAQQEGNEYMQKNLEKNVPGSPATDFTFVDRKGKRRTLYSEKAPLTVLFFYDPDCHVCHEIAKQLSKVDLFTRSKRVKVLSIYTDVETERWKAHASGFPKSWTDGYSPDGEIMLKELFYLPHIPSIYLLDAGKRVLLHDVSPETLIAVVKQLTNS
jgi:thiol-disulfide isomerase/thioredoxin